MSMFDTFGSATDTSSRSENTRRKLARLNAALRHEEPDRVPISDFFWGRFIERWRRELKLPETANPYHHYNLDWIVTVPNMDPWIRPFETLSETDEEVVVKTGFGAVMHKHFKLPMPEMRAWEIDTFENWRGPNSTTTRAIRGGFSPPVTIRSPGWETVSSAIRRRGSKP